MVDSQTGIIREDGGGDACVVIECGRCDKRIYVYAENGELPITIGDLPCFCRWCGRAYGAWEIEFHGSWDPIAKVSNDVSSEDE
jgi:hypothetical protein